MPSLKRRDSCEICGSVSNLVNVIVTDSDEHSIKPPDVLPSGSAKILCERHYHNLTEEKQGYHVREVPPKVEQDDNPLLRHIAIAPNNHVVSSERSAAAWMQYDPRKAFDLERNR